MPDTTAAVDLTLCELGGSDVHGESAVQYLLGTHAAVIVFDLSNRESYEHCKKWLEVLRQCRADKERPLKAVLVANKADLPPQRQVVSAQSAKEWAVMNGLEFAEVSCKPPGRGVEAPFTALARAYYKGYEDKKGNWMELATKY